MVAFSPGGLLLSSTTICDSPKSAATTVSSSLRRQLDEFRSLRMMHIVCKYAIPEEMPLTSLTFCCQGKRVPIAQKVLQCTPLSVLHQQTQCLGIVQNTNELEHVRVVSRLHFHLSQESLLSFLIAMN